MSKLVWASVLLALYYVVVELPAPTFDVHSAGGVVVSGASSGIGLDAAIHLATKGLTVFAGVRKEADGASALAECVRQHNAQVCENLVPVILDVTKAETIASTHATVQAWTIKTGLPLVAVVNNAGISKNAPCELLKLQDYRDVFEVNLFGVVALTKAFLPMLRASKGRIVNLSSVAGVVAAGALSAYGGSKFALEGLTDSLRKEMRPLGVAVVLINPGYIVTKIGDKVISYTQSIDTDPAMKDLYSRYLTEESVKSNFALADTTEVTNAAIEDAIYNPRPKARYFVANVDGVPAIVSAVMARIMPTYLFDLIVEFF